jgi:glycosyltransferase involved in cell wall biosynthesis
MSAEKQMEVSVIIPAYNRADSLLRAIRSVGQPRAATEIIVVDDGSTDGTAEILRREILRQNEGPVIRFYAQKNQGAPAARNLGLQKASGTFVKFLDSDDLLIEGSLDQEVDHARQTDVEVVVCGWIEQTTGENHQRREVEAPQLQRGIDDMLCGRSVWTAAALYKRSFIKDLRWDRAHGKADDWGWVWRVCLAGARFSRLDVFSAVYCLYDGERITQQGNPYFDSTRMRQRILHEVEKELCLTNRLTPERRDALIRYYLKDRIVLASRDPIAWDGLCSHIHELSPGFIPKEEHPWVKPFVRWLGLHRGIRTYALLSGAARFVRRSKNSFTKGRSR